MPLFEYRCHDCGAEFEELVRYEEADRITCSYCKSLRVERLLSKFAVSRDASLSASAEPGPCGACGAPQRGMCAMERGDW